MKFYKNYLILYKIYERYNSLRLFNILGIVGVVFTIVFFDWMDEDEFVFKFGREFEFRELLEVIFFNLVGLGFWFWLILFFLSSIRITLFIFIELLFEVGVFSLIDLYNICIIGNRILFIRWCLLIFEYN